LRLKFLICYIHVIMLLNLSNVCDLRIRSLNILTNRNRILTEFFKCLNKIIQIFHVFIVWFTIVLSLILICNLLDSWRWASTTSSISQGHDRVTVSRPSVSFWLSSHYILLDNIYLVLYFTDVIYRFILASPTFLYLNSSIAHVIWS